MWNWEFAAEALPILLRGFVNTLIATIVGFLCGGVIPGVLGLLGYLKAALKGVTGAEGFMSAASPGVVSLFFRNDHYKDQDAYLEAIAEAMRDEYETVTKAGFTLQIDCPDLGMGRHIQYADLDLKDFRRRIGAHIEALNHATRNIAPEQMRLHLCWGNYEGPHHRDVPLADIVDIVFGARPHAISLEAANPRHAHEYTLFETVKLPPGKVLIPGVISHSTVLVEHPELVAERITRYASLVGRERVIAGSDCGFATFAGSKEVHPSIVWAKFEALAEGAGRVLLAPTLVVVLVVVVSVVVVVRSPPMNVDSSHQASASASRMPAPSVWREPTWVRSGPARPFASVPRMV